MRDNGCSGLCCAAFYIAYTITDIRRGVNPKNGKGLRDSEQIAAMLVRLTPKEARERNVRFGGAGVGWDWDRRGHFFTCRHWDEETGLCKEYEDRPPMCSQFPYGKEHGCPFGCSCLGAPTRRVDSKRAPAS